MLRTWCAAAIVAVGISWQVPAWAGPYDVPAANAVAWLASHQNVVDGSWGATDDLRYVRTSEAVLGMAAFDRRTPELYAGITWLENHTPANVDFRARRVLALQANGDNVSADLAALQAVQKLALPGNSGFGLSQNYQGATLDTALTLQALSAAGVTTNVAAAVGYLKATQLTGTDRGWAMVQGAPSDPVVTSQVLIALIGLQATDATLPAIITAGLGTLNARVVATSPSVEVAAAALANLKSSATAAAATPLLNALVSTQAADGSWGADAYPTALAVRAFAVALGRDLAAQRVAVYMPDANLRAAVNGALGRNALDSINIGELSHLTTLTLSGDNIKDLTGLQVATNLTYLDLRNNQITTFVPIAALKIPTLLISGNPGAPSDGGDVPTLPEWGEILLGSLLLLLASQRAARRPGAL